MLRVINFRMYVCIIKTLRDKWSAQKKKSAVQIVLDSRQYPPTHGSYKLSCIFVETLAAPKSSLIDWPRMAFCKWPMCASPLTQPPIPHPCNYLQSRGEKKAVMTVTRAVAVHTVTVILNQVLIVCGRYVLTTENVGQPPSWIWRPRQS